eukprot:COSAG06_NODE_35813_length_455_cov_0.901685_1_plen_86_part_00
MVSVYYKGWDGGRRHLWYHLTCTETATNVVRVVARCATTDGGKWVGLVSDLALRSHSRRTAHRLVGGGRLRYEEWTECVLGTNGP